MSTDSIILPVKRLLWVIIGVAALVAIGIAVFISVTRGSVRVSLVPAPLMAALCGVSGLALLRLVWDFLTAEFVLRITRDGVAGWSQPDGLRSYRARFFEYEWSTICSIDVVKRWSVPQVRIVADSGRHVFINPNYIAGFGLADADLIVTLLEERRALNQ